MSLQAGDTVVLKCGNGPVMVIGEIGTTSDPDGAVCFWGGGELSAVQRQEIPIAALKSYTEPRPEPLPEFRNARGAR